MNELIEPSTLTSLSRAQLRSARALLHRKTREATGEFIAEGAQAVREALAAGAARLVIVSDAAEHTQLLAGCQVPVVAGSAADLRALSTTVTPQGVVAICARPQAGFADLPDDAKLVVVCAQVRDPGNAGTVIRCADAFGADGVVFTSESVELTNPKTVRASVGSIFHLPVVTGAVFDDALAWCAGHGLQTLAADMGGIGLDELCDELARPTAWVLGNEAWGLPPEQAGACDRVVSIPMWGRAESLNLSTAAAVCLFATAAQQRR